MNPHTGSARSCHRLEMVAVMPLMWARSYLGIWMAGATVLLSGAGDSVCADPCAPGEWGL